MPHHTFFRRHENNPILTAADWPYPAHAVFNPGAVRLADGTTLLLCRVEQRRGHSHLCAARSADGVAGWSIDPRPTLAPDPDTHPEEIWGLEDPRITYCAELDKYAIAYTAYSAGGPAVALAVTGDFQTFERYGVVMPPDNKDAAVLPRRIEGRWAMIHRPSTHFGAHIWISYSPDLRHWGEHRMILRARRGGWWDAGKIGLAPPPLETERGWLMIYHGVRVTASGSLYRVGLALFDRTDPERCLYRGDTWVFGPEAPYEREGDVPNVVFPCGCTIGDDGDTVNLYYGASDTSIGLATGSLRELFAWIDGNGRAELKAAEPDRPGRFG